MCSLLCFAPIAVVYDSFNQSERSIAVHLIMEDKIPVDSNPDDKKAKQVKLPNAFDKISPFFLCSTLSDVTIVFGEGPDVQSFPGHKFLLSMSSPVFEAMFYGPLASNKKEIRLKEEDPEAFKTVLRYLYTDEPQLKEEIVMATLYSAKKYMLDKLEEECIAFAIQNLNWKNAITIYQQVIELSRLFIKHFLFFTFFTF
jgi:hypothetical protein